MTRPVTYKSMTPGVHYKNSKALDIALYVSGILEECEDYTKVKGFVYHYRLKEIYERGEYTITADQRSFWHSIG